MNFRHEWKHFLNYADFLVLRTRLGAVMRRDPYAGPGGKYLISSLYFDNLSDKALREKLDGVNRREKFRIRYYNSDLSLIHLEKKCKINGLGTKEQEAVTAQEVQRMIDGGLRWMDDPARPLVFELYRKMTAQGLRPRTVVDYTREPFVYAPGNVRVTLDYNIRTALNVGSFLSPDGGVTLPAGEPVYLLEVKWDEWLPDIIRDAVQLPSRQASAFSKYAACRIYG